MKPWPFHKKSHPFGFLPGFLAKKSGTVDFKRKSMWIMPTAGSKTLGIQNVGESLGILWPKVKNLLGKKIPDSPRKKIHVASTTIIKRHLSHDSPNVFPDFGTIWPCKAFTFWQHVSQNAKPHRSRDQSLQQPKRGFRRSPFAAELPFKVGTSRKTEGKKSHWLVTEINFNVHWFNVLWKR